MELTTSTNALGHKVVKLRLNFKTDRGLTHGPAGNNITLLAGLCEPYEVVEQIKDLFFWIRSCSNTYQCHYWDNLFLRIDVAANNERLRANSTRRWDIACLFEVKQPIRFQLEAIQWRAGCRYDPAPVAQYLSLLKALNGEGTFKAPQPLSTASILSAFKRRAT